MAHCQPLRGLPGARRGLCWSKDGKRTCKTDARSAAVDHESQGRPPRHGHLGKFFSDLLDRYHSGLARIGGACQSTVALIGGIQPLSRRFTPVLAPLRRDWFSDDEARLQRHLLEPIRKQYCSGQRSDHQSQRWQPTGSHHHAHNKAIAQRNELRTQIEAVRAGAQAMRYSMLLPLLPPINFASLLAERLTPSLGLPSGSACDASASYRGPRKVGAETGPQHALPPRSPARARHSLRVNSSAVGISWSPAPP